MAFLNTKEAAEILSVSQRTIQRWLENGDYFKSGDYQRNGYNYSLKPEAVERLRKQFDCPF